MMEKHDLANKLGQIEDLAKDTLAEFPLSLTKERLRMIIALARYLRTEVSASIDPISEAGQRADANADSAARRG
jgi:hypothetical protein